MRQPDSPTEFQRAELQSLQRDVVALREKITTTKHRQVVRTPVVSGLLRAVALLGAPRSYSPVQQIGEDDLARSFELE